MPSTFNAPLRGKGLWLAFLLCIASSAHAAAATIHAVVETPARSIPLTLEVAATPEMRTHGLMDRHAIGAADGMLFVFPEPGHHLFWMKDTQIPLDMLFLDTAHRIVAITHGKPRDLTPLGPDAPTAAVIELDGGRAARDGIAAGDKVTYALPPSIEVR